jgi:hypothetical protein
MANKPKPKYTPKHLTSTWTVTIDNNTPTTVEADQVEVTEQGALLFTTDDAIIRAVAIGHWSTVEFVPPPEPEPTPTKPA